MKDLQDTAHRALQEIGAPAIGPLIAALNDPDPNFRRKVVDVLTTITGRENWGDDYDTKERRSRQRAVGQ
jgi:hypothetical protein